MQTTVNFLDELAAKHGGCSDYRLAKVLGITRQNVSSLKHGRSYLGDETALKVAAELDLEPGYVLASVYAERAARANAPDVRKAWESLALRVAASVVLGVGVGGLVAGVTLESAPALTDAMSRVCVLCKIALRSNLIDFAPIFAALSALGSSLWLIARRLRT